MLFNDVADMKETLAPIGEGVDFSDEAACTLRIQEILSEPVGLKIPSPARKQILGSNRDADSISLRLTSAFSHFFL